MEFPKEVQHLSDADITKLLVWIRSVPSERWTEEMRSWWMIMSNTATPAHFELSEFIVTTNERFMSSG